jgi:hypothetical protein
MFRHNPGSVSQKSTSGHNLAVTGDNNRIYLNAAATTYPFVEITSGATGSAQAATRSRPEPIGQASEALKVLAEQRCLKIVGNPGVGKSTLVTMLGRDERYSKAYYTDLVQLTLPLGLTDVTNLLSRISELCDEFTIMIVDNVHLQPEIETDIAEHWRAYELPGFLLFASRRVEHITSGVPSIEVGMSRENLLIVLNYVAGVSGVVIESPPSDVVDRWVEEFPDLVSFGMALEDRLPSLARGSWDLSQRHAIARIREVYLSGRSASEIANMRLLAVAGEWDCALSERALVDGGVSEFVSNGLIQQDGGYYLVSHAGVARLLRRALYIGDATEVLREIAAGDPIAAFTISIAMSRSGDSEGARATLANLVNADRKIRSDVVQDESLETLAMLASALIRKHLVDNGSVDEQLSAKSSGLRLKLLETVPDRIVIAAASLRDLPSTHKQVLAYLDEPAVVIEFVGWARGASIVQLTSSVNLLRGLKKAALATQLAQTLVDDRPHDADKIILGGTTAGMRFLLQVAELVGAEGTFLERARGVLAQNTPTVVERLLQRSVDEYFSYDDVLQKTWPSLVRQFRSGPECIERGATVSEALAHASLGSVIRAHLAVGERDGWPFAETLVEGASDEIKRRFDAPSIGSELLDLYHTDLALLFRIGGGAESMSTQIAKAVELLRDDAYALGTRHLESGLGPFLHVGEVLDRDADAAAVAYRDLLLDPDVQDTVRRLLPDASREIATRIHLWSSAIVEKLPADIVESLRAKSFARPIRAPGGRQSPLLAALCQRADRAFPADAAGTLSAIEEILAPLDINIPAVAGRLLAIAAIGAVGLDGRYATFSRLTQKDQYFALVGAAQMSGLVPSLEEEMWRRLLAAYSGDRMISLVSVSRLMAVVRGIRDSPCGFAGRCDELAASWYGTREDLIRHIDGVLHRYAEDPSTVTLPIYPYHVLSYVRVRESLAGRNAKLESEVSRAVAASVSKMSRNNKWKFGQWRDYSPLAQRALAIV